MKVSSDNSVTATANKAKYNERRSVTNKQRDTGNKNKVTNVPEKVERTLKAKNNLQSNVAPERKLRDSVTKPSRKCDKSVAAAALVEPQSPTSRKPCSPQRIPLNPKKVPSPSKNGTDFSLANVQKVAKKVPKILTPDSSDNEKAKQNQNAKKSSINAKYACGQVAPNSKSATVTTKRPKVTLKRQLALDNAPPSNLNRSCSETASNESLNSITSVTQLLKLERSSFNYSSNNSNNSGYEDDDADDELAIATGGVKYLAARWQAITSDNNNELNTNQNGILRKNKVNKANSNHEEDNTKTKLFEAIKQNELLLKNKKKEGESSNKRGENGKMTKTNDMEVKRKSSVGHKNVPVSAMDNKSQHPQKQQQQQPQGRRKSEGKASTSVITTTALSEAAEAILQTAAVVTAASPGDKKISSNTSARTKAIPTNSSLSSSLPPAALSPKRASYCSGVTTTTAAKKAEDFSKSSLNTAKKETNCLATTKTRPRSRSASPIVTTTGSVSSTLSGPNKPLFPLLSRGRSTNRRSTVDSITTHHTNLSTSAFSHCPTSRRTRSASSTPGLPSYAAATATSLAKQTNQIRDHNHKEESSATATSSAAVSKTNKSSNHKSHLINANPSASGTSTAAAAVRRGQGQQRNVGLNNKNRIRDGHSSRRNEKQITTAPLKNATSLIKTSSTVNTARKPKDTNIVLGSTSKLKSDTGNKANCKNTSSLSSTSTTNTNTKRKVSVEGSNFSASSLSSSSSSPSYSSASNRQQHKQTKHTNQPRILPSIIMSEYVDNDDEDNRKLGGGHRTKLAHTKNLFIPLQFIEPLKNRCDTVEGNRLELKVRVKGAEAVIWTKGKKIVAHAPPDIEYFQDKTTNLYGLRIADVFLEDSGIYICEAYGAGGSEIACWCQVHVLETGRNKAAVANQQRPQCQLYDDVDVDEEDISWEDLNMSEEIKSPKPLVVPVIVTSQAEQQEIEPSPVFEMAKESPSPIRRVSVVSQIDTEEETEICTEDEQERENQDHHEDHDHLRKLHKNESATEQEDESNENAEGVSSHVKSSQFNSSSIKMTEEVESNQCQLAEEDDNSNTGKRKLISEVSSASDESIYLLKEPRSGDEGVLSSAEETGSAYVSLDAKSNVTNDDDISNLTLISSSVDSPIPPGAPTSSSTSPSCGSSEQNGRSSSVDSAIGFIGRPLFSDGKFPPRILVGPNNIIALYDEVVHLRVKVQNYGIPKTAVNWFKFINGTYKKIELNSGDQSSSQGDAHKVSITKCGTSLCTLTISHVNYDDCGRYRVKVQNLLGMDSHDCLLTVEGPPEAPGTPPKVKYDEKSKTILIQWSSCPYDGGSKITGYYVEASIVQGSKTAINRDDIDNWQLLTPQSYSWLCYTLTNPKRGSVYRFRVFGENSYGKGKPTEPSLPLLVPVLMEGRRAGSSDALLWSMKSLSPEETALRADATRKLLQEEESLKMSIASAVQEEEEPVEYRNVTVKRESFYNVYDKMDELGKGRFGIVFEVQHKVSKKSYAGKFVKCIKAKDKERVVLEVKIMNELGYHPKLICLIDAFEMPREIVIVTQRINGGELFERVVADDFTLTEGDCITFLQQICDAVRYIHAKNIMHLDLKPENILCTSKHTNLIKIIDFGLAQYYDEKEPIRVLFGTAEFVSPEIINYEPIAPSTDNWSVGVITYILLSGLSPFMGDNDNETFSNITRAEFDFEDEAFEKISDDAKDFISKLIVKRPEKRMTAEECLSHRWLKQESMDYKKDVILSTDKLKRFLVRRKWQKTGNAIRALSRMTTLYSRRSSSASSASPNGSMSVSSPPPPSSRLSFQESAEDNVFFCSSQQHSNNSLDNNNLSFNNNINQQVANQSLIKTATTTTKSGKFADPSRSDSGVCDVGGSFSSSLNFE